MTSTADDRRAATRKTLDALGDELETRSAALRAGGEIPSGGISFGKRVGEGTSIAIERFTDVAIHDQILQQQAAVRHALERLDEGTYGTCETCGCTIPAARLEAVPWASRCVHCA